MLQKRIVGTLLLLCVFVFSYAQEMVFSAQANAGKVGTKDQFQITYTLSNAPNANNFRPPAFDGFVIVGGPFQSNNNSISVVNGQRRMVSSVSLTYLLVPKKAGNYTIPGAKVEVNGKDVSSNAINLVVVNGSLVQQRQPQQSFDPFGDDDPFEAFRQQQQMMRQRMQQQQQRQQQQQQQQQTQLSGLGEEHINKNIFIKVSVDKTNPYVGEQITASYKLYTRLAMSVNLTGLPSLNGFWSQDFQIPNPPKPTEEVINGQRYQVFLLKKTALFPQQDGTLLLDAAKAEGVVRVVQQVKGRNPFADDPFFGSFFMDDPFFNEDMFSGYNYKDVPVKLSSMPVKINVKPLPLANQPESFTGAVGNFTVNATIDKQSLTTDDAATLTFTINGSGNLKLIGNPIVNFPPELGVYEPTITDTITSRNPAIAGRKIFAYTMNPQTPGEFVIPAITFSYYDAASGTYKTQQTNSIKLQVTKGKNYSVAKAAETLPGDIHDIEKGALVYKSKSPIAASKGYWALYVVAIGGVCFLLWKDKQQKKYAGNEALFRNKKANKIAWKRLAKARKLLPENEHKAFYEEVSKAIWLYLSDKMNVPLSQLSKEKMEEVLAEQQVPEAFIQNINKLTLECEMALYSPVGGRQQRTHTLDEATKIIGALESVLKSKKNNTAQYVG